MSRPSNPALVADFRRLLTEDFYAVDPDGVVFSKKEMEPILAETKPWRNDLWQAFREIADRLDPVSKFERTGTP